jgi:hypothetical protein
MKRISILALIATLSILTGLRSNADVPHMLPRPIHPKVVLGCNGESSALIVAPQKGPFAEVGREIQGIIHEATGVTIPICSPENVTDERGLLLTPEAKKKNLVFVGNLSVNPALLEPYMRRMFVADEDDPGSGRFKIVTHPNPWGTGVGLVLIGASDAEGMGKALKEFRRIAREHAKPGELILERVILPGPDPLRDAVRSYWKRMARPKNEDMIQGFKRAKSMHLGYYIARKLFEFTLITDLGYLTEKEVNDIENEVLENVLMIPEKVWWYRSGEGSVGTRHELFKNPRLYLAVEHLLKVGRPNAEARRRLERMAKSIREYMHYVVTKAYHPDFEGEFEDGQAWQTVVWFALVEGDWDYFKSGRAREAALYYLLQTDNLGCLAGHVPYGGLTDLYAKTTARNAIRAATWWYQDGRFKWLLEHMPFTREYPYGFPLRLPLGDIKPERPSEWSGVTWLSISPHSYTQALNDENRGRLGISRDRTVELLVFREGFSPDDQYLCLDGFHNPGPPLGINCVLRYVDRGKLFLVAHTGKEGNYYKSGVVVSRGIRTEPDPWGVELVAAANLPHIGLTATSVPRTNGCDWKRCIFWKRGEYFLFIDEVKAREPGQYSLTATWRTCSPAELKDEGWMQRQGDVTFWLKPAFNLNQQARRADEGEYQGELVPYLLRQFIQFHPEKEEERTSFQNILYATGSGDERDFTARRVSPTACIARGVRKQGGKEEKELAIMGLGDGSMPNVPLKTDAALFYVSPERVAIADGTFLQWKDARIISRNETGDEEVEISDDHLKGIIRNDLESLWRRIERERERCGGAIALRAEVGIEIEPQIKWRFDGFRPHLQRVIPTDVEKSPDGRIWTYRFDREVKLAEVIVGEPPIGAIPEPKAFGRSFEEVVVEFSSDGFKEDIRTAPSQPKSSYRILGPRGKSYFYVQNLLIFPGGRCKAVRVRLVKWRKNPNVKPFIDLVELYSTKRERAEICRLFTSDLNGDGRREVIALTKDNQLVVLNDEGEKLWEYTFRHKVISLEALDVDEDGLREILACDAASYLYRFAPDGSLEGKMHLSTSEDFYEDFFRFNRAYSMGLWHPQTGELPALILGTYQSIAWITSDDQIIWRPSGEEFKLPTQSGYLWHGLVYWEKVLPNGIDLNGDGTEDQAFMSYGWGGARPSVIFFDGARRDAMAEYGIPNGRPIGLEVIHLPDGHRAILAINEFHLGLYSTEGAKELWRVRFDTPAAAYAVVYEGNHPIIYVAKRDGLVMSFDMNGRVIGRRLLSPELTALAPIRIGSSTYLMVASNRGITILSTALRITASYRWGGASKLAVPNDTTVLEACNGEITSLAFIPAAK